MHPPTKPSVATGDPPPCADRLLQAAIARRDRYLAQHPHLVAYQAEIDRLLDKAGDHRSRLAVLATLVQGKVLALQGELGKLGALLQQTAAMVDEAAHTSTEAPSPSEPSPPGGGQRI